MKTGKKSVLSMVMAIVMLVSVFGVVAQAESVPETPTVYYVSLEGTAEGDGSEANPFPTLEAARDAIRASGVPDGGVTVYLHEGEYRRNEPFVLTAEDSGTEANPVIYAAYPGEAVSILGSQALDNALFEKLSDAHEGVAERIAEEAKDKIYAYNLSANGVNCGENTPIGMGSVDNTIPEVLLDGVRIKAARYPNEEFMHPDAVVDGFVSYDDAGVENLPWDVAPVFRQDDARFQKWALEDDAWLRGYFRFDWADEMHKIVQAAPDAEQEGSTLFTIDEQCKYGTSANPEDIKYYGYNLLCELDIAGEYYIDRSADEKYLYIYLDDPENASVVITSNEGAVIDMQSAAYITIQGISLGETWQQGVLMTDCESCAIVDCEIFRTGQYGVQIGIESYDTDFENDWFGGKNNQVVGCKIYDTGMGGVICSGGNYERLENANNAVIDCEIYDFSQNVRTYTPAVNLYGVGNIARGNTIYNAPHDAIQVQGNNMIIEHNDISNVLTETGDAGVIYSGRSWVRRGNIIRYNYIHDVPNVSSTSNAIYLDDAMSGWEVYGNVLHNIADSGSLYGGGRDLTIYGNMYINVGQAYKIDDRTLTFLSANNESLKTNYEEAPIDSDIWKAAYPSLYETLGHLDIDVDAINAQPDAEKDVLNPVIPANISIQDETLVNTSVGSIAALARRFGSINLNPGNYTAEDAAIADNLPAFTAVLLSADSTEEDIAAAKDAFLANLEEKPFDKIARGTPVVDGEMDDLYAASVQIPLDERFWYWGDEAVKKDPDNSGFYTMLWDDKFLYMYVNVKDDEILTAGYDYVMNMEDTNPWQNDVSEVFIDGYKLSLDAFGLRCFTEQDKFTNEYLATMQRATTLLKDGEIVKRTSEYTPEELVRGFQAEEADTYVTEFAIPLATILGKTPVENADAVMIRIQINDALGFSDDGAHMWISDNPTTRILVLGGAE